MKSEILDSFLTNLVLDEYRETYRNMTKAQQRIVRFALLYDPTPIEQRVKTDENRT